MAEQEVCADVVAKTKEESNGRIEGESLLLPLLQGLLDAPDNEQTADSGTESGEDLRSGLLVEVQNVLAKLAKSLTSDTNEMTPDKRTSLLQLVARLQTGLSATPAPGAPGSGDRRGSGGGQGRFGRRRRQNRHTVGVSSEELQDARRLMAEFGLCDNLEVASQPKVPLQKQNSEGSVLQFKTLEPKAPVKNAVAKPYGNSTSTSQSHSGTSSTVETPEESDAAEFNYTRPEIKPPDTNVKLTRSTSFETKPVSSNFPTEIEKKSVTQESETDEETVKGLLQTNPIYSKPKSPELDDSKSNRFNSKKLKMKRANTIDIPKPLEFYESEDDYDSDTSMLDKQNRRNNYLALRGPIRVGRNNSNTIVPAFEPKTDSDRKFMAFINKHSDDSNKSSIWAHKQTTPDRSGTNWTSRFGNIKTAFEKASTSSPSTPNTNMSSARNFWKSADDAMSAGKQSYNGPKIYKQGARNLQQMFEDKQAAQKPPWNDEKNIVTGSLKFDTKKNIKVVPQVVSVVPVVPQAQPVNKFSHAPTSAFAAIPKKLPPPQTIQAATQTTPKPIIEPPEVIKSDYKESDSDSSTPLYLYSPKPLQTSPLGSSANTSPSTTPWGSTINENRVQKLAASKFEAPPKEVHERPRKMSREENTDKKASTVRKLSSQFDCKNNSGYSAFTTVKYGQNLNNFQPQNYTITYANQKGTNGYQPFHKYQEEKTKSEPTLSSNSFKTKKVEPQNYNTKKAEPQNYSGVYTTPKVYQANPPIPPPPQEYTSHQVIQFNQPPKKEVPKYEYSSPESSPTPQKPQYRRQTSQESIKEYEAAVTRVMKGPVSHQAVTVQQKSPKGRDEHDMEAAFNLKSVLQKFSSGEKKEERVSKKSASNRVKYELPPERKLSIDSASIAQNKQSKATATATANLQRTQSFKKAYQYDSNPAPNFLVNGKPLSMESTEINEDGESIITSKFHIPVRSSAKQEPQIKPTPPPPRTVNSQTVLPPPPTSRQVLSKSDSWHQLMHEHQKAQQKPTSPTPSKPVVRSKSSHTLAVPTVQFQAGMTKDEVALKKRTVEAYFSGKISPSDDSLEKSDKEVKSTKTSINRKKTSEKVSIHRHGVTRSRTLPNIVCPNLLDESNVEASFEDLFKSNV